MHSDSYNSVSDSMKKIIDTYFVLPARLGNTCIFFHKYYARKNELVPFLLWLSLSIYHVYCKGLLRLFEKVLSLPLILTFSVTSRISLA